MELGGLHRVGCGGEGFDADSTRRAPEPPRRTASREPRQIMAVHGDAPDMHRVIGDGEGSLDDTLVPPE
ncbi:hypothetical protein ACFQE1_21835, partial [Halobium palmae]